METPKPQELQSLDYRDYKHRIVVFGTRYYNNKVEFHAEMMALLERLNGEPVIFFSGAAKSGADYLIIRWCRKFNFPCILFPADWDKNQKAAGFIRNTEMAKLATYGLGFWDHVSNGTKHMIAQLDYFQVSHKTIFVEIPDAVQ